MMQKVERLKTPNTFMVDLDTTPNTFCYTPNTFVMDLDTFALDLDTTPNTKAVILNYKISNNHL